MGLSQPPGGPQRSFLVAVLHDLVKLTCWDHQLLLQETPADFLALLGTQPAFAGLPTPVPYPPPPAPPAGRPSEERQQQQLDQPAGDGAAGGQEGEPPAAGGDQQMADADTQAGAEPQTGSEAADEAADAMQQDEQGQQQQLELDAIAQPEGKGDAAMDEAGAEPQAQQQDPEMLWAGKLLGVMQSRPPPERKPLTYEQVLEWIDSQEVRQLTTVAHSSQWSIPQ